MAPFVAIKDSEVTKLVDDAYKSFFFSDGPTKSPCRSGYWRICGSCVRLETGGRALGRFGHVRSLCARRRCGTHLSSAATKGVPSRTCNPKVFVFEFLKPTHTGPE